MSTKKEILSAGAANVTITIEIEAPLAKTWKTMIEDIGSWWRSDFLICEGSQGMNLEPKIGGLLYEKIDEHGGGFVWGNVISFQPEKNLSYIAQIVPPWGGPAQSVVQISLAPVEGREDAATILTLTDSLIGHVSDEFASSLDAGWTMLYGEGGLKTYVESY